MAVTICTFTGQLGVRAIPLSAPFLFRSQIPMQDVDVVFAAIEGHYPEYKTIGSAGGDLRSVGEHILKPHETKKIPSGLKSKLPMGYALFVKPRSSLALKKGLLVVEGTIDADYRGEIGIVVHNLTDKEVVVEDMERIAQAIILELPRLSITQTHVYDEFADAFPSDRGEGGFGSTGTF